MAEQPLMQEEYKEVWEVYVSGQREPYILNEREYTILQDSLLKGVKGVIHFDKFMINTAYIVSSYLKKREIVRPRLTEPQNQKLTEAQLKERRELLAKYRKKILNT